jgi:periplasmic protein TonB
MSGSRRPAPSRSRRIFLVFLVASIAAHAAVLGIFAWIPAQDSSPMPAGVLQVALLEPRQLPAGPPEPASQSRARAPVEARARPAARPRPATRAQLLELPELHADERRSFAVGADLPELVATPGTGPAAAPAVAVIPPSLDPAYLQNPLPRYPASARRAGEQGTVMLRVLVSREGTAARVEVDKSSGSAHLDAAARETVKAWRFGPARRGGEAVESWMVVPVVFRLEGSS